MARDTESFAADWTPIASRNRKGETTHPWQTPVMISKKSVHLSSVWMQHIGHRRYRWIWQGFHNNAGSPKGSASAHCQMPLQNQWSWVRSGVGILATSLMIVQTGKVCSVQNWLAWKLACSSFSHSSTVHWRWWSCIRQKIFPGTKQQSESLPIIAVAKVAFLRKFDDDTLRPIIGDLLRCPTSIQYPYESCGKVKATMLQQLWADLSQSGCFPLVQMVDNVLGFLSGDWADVDRQVN